MDDDIINIILNNIKGVFFPMCDFIVPKNSTYQLYLPFQKPCEYNINFKKLDIQKLRNGHCNTVWPS